MTYHRVRAAAFALVFAAAGPFAGAAGAQETKKSIDLPERSAVHGFSVALVLGDMQAGSSPDNLPPGARKALGDMRDFLPYKSYQLLDTQWILCCGPSKAGAGVSGRLRGISQVGGSLPAPVPLYAFAVTVLGASGSQLAVRFSLTDGADLPLKNLSQKLPDESAAIFDTSMLKLQEQELETLLADTRKKYTAQHPSVKELELKLETTRAQIQGLTRARTPPGKGAIIDSTFSMDIGETVVIGTSSLKGDKALIALLTAARRPGTQTSTLGEKR